MSIGMSSPLDSSLVAGFAGALAGAFPVAAAAAATASASSFLLLSSSSLYLIILLYSLGLTILTVFIVSSQSLNLDPDSGSGF